ncbi:MAG TPA: sigma-70 family RNA polymerase sigma factor [Puia sp.]|nr:sigma-70 family RNA polymerase sigma factor [Puia sp.]
MNDPIEKIWSRFGQQLSELICHKTGHQDHCHDILQEVYIKLVKNVDKIEKANNVLPYVVKIANNTIVDYYRAHQGNNSTANSLIGERSADDPNLSGEDPTSKLARSFMLELIEALPPLYRQALVRTELEGISQKQLAEELGISYSGAKSRVQRAKEMVRQSILNCCNYKFDKYGNVISCCGSDCS